MAIAVWAGENAVNTGMTMAQIRPRTLVQCIQSVAAEIRNLEAALADGDGEAEEHVLLEAWQAAADDLEAAYDKLTVNVLNLPPYDELVSK